jgi:hypothetical protein
MKFELNNDSIAVIVVLLVFVLGFHIGKYSEKMAAVEDIVFNCGVYEKAKQEVAKEVHSENGM